MDPLFAAAGRAMVTPTPMGRERAELITVGSFYLGWRAKKTNHGYIRGYGNVSLTVDSVSTGRLQTSDSKVLSLAKG